MSITGYDLAAQFTEALNKKFENGGYELELKRNRKYHRISIKNSNYSTNQDRSVFAFVNENGHLLKPASWQAPALHTRYDLNTEFDAAVAEADPFGSFLYFR